MQAKHGSEAPGAHGARSQTPSGPSGSWHCTPASLQTALGGEVTDIGSHPSDAIERKKAAIRRVPEGRKASSARSRMGSSGAANPKLTRRAQDVARERPLRWQFV